MASGGGLDFLKETLGAARRMVRLVQNLRWEFYVSDVSGW